ncbi:hypothetical protein EOA32_03210 [Mesorhizobium sp. M1A.F.Ca.ET.072.01.1.1]|uniref:phage tail length tape measure family protein n=1 Tax=Mesorhizobium sp. M1A.F.Ca.ET.072.01.1.1 TaxID=2496753 RepID=UPI000FD1FD94|nr:phage tail length tape measure family protein [Mesorhizobium sp. M1A.F.Ca.ET.072.01.1.1]RUW55045.1 hypothetical protein EOA32_03210 [Mesorhizobium sp. M1A.F.Ca.ET.072.01.1.1]TIV04718.1 MAG: hypothetical protein E5W04_02200 [Mesorhizobium sp.]
MSDKTDDLLISVSTDLTTIKRQLKQLGQDVGQTTSGIQKQFDSLGKGIDQSMSPIQKRINAMIGIPVSSRVKEWKGALAEVADTSKLTSSQVLNLTRQGNDLATMFALGANPMQIFASQAGQIFDALQSGPGGAMASIKAIGEGAIGLATKFPLATAAIAAAGVAFIAYEMVGGSHLKTLDEITKTHEGNIKLLGDAWDDAAAKKKKYAALPVSSVNSLNDKEVQNSKDLLATQIKGIFDEVYKTIGAGGGGQGPLQKVLRSQFEPFKQALDDLANTSDVKVFLAQIESVAEANPKLASTRDALRDLATEAAKTAAEIPGLGQPVDEIADTIDEFNRKMASVTSEPLQKALQDIFDDAKSGKTSIDEINAAIAALEQANPSFAGIIAGLRGIIIEAHGASQAVADAYAKAAGSSPNGRVYNPLAAQVDDAVARGANIVPTPAPNREDLGHEYDKAAEAAKRKADAAARRAARAQPKTADDRFAEDLQSIRDRTAALNEEYNALGLSYEAQTKRSTALDLEQQALKQVREEARKKGDTDWQNAQLTPAQIAQIDAVSDAYARQADALRKAQEMQDLQRDVLKGAFDDLRSALDDGKLDWQDFAKIAENALDKVIDKIENDLLDAIMQANSAGGGGGIGSIFSAIFGGGSSGNVFPGGGALNSDMGLYDTGGYTGPGGKKKVAGLVHKGEVVFSQDDVARNGGVAAVQAMRRGRAIAAPQMPAIQAPAARGGDIGVTFAPSISVQGGGNDAGEQVTAALKKFEKEFTPKVVKSIRDAKVRGML